MIQNSNKLEQANKFDSKCKLCYLFFFMSVDTAIMWGGMKGSEEYCGDRREQRHTRVTKVLGIVQFVLGVAVICARVAEVGGTWKRCSLRGQGLLRKANLLRNVVLTRFTRFLKGFHRALYESHPHPAFVELSK